MQRRILAVIWVLLVSVTPPLAAQAVPEGAQARGVDMGYRRTSQFRVDPFRYAMIPHWGLIISGGVSGENNALDMGDLGAIKFLSDTNAFQMGDFLDMVTLIPSGSGFGSQAQGEAGLAISAAFGSRVSVGITGLVARGYGAFEIDDDAIALMRDGNGARQSFSLGESQGVGIVTLESGVHGVLRTNPLGSPDGVQLVLGFGMRLVVAPVYARAHSRLANGGRVLLTGDSIAANLDVEVAVTDDIQEFSDFFDRAQALGEIGLASDFLVRGEWPSSGLAVELMVANLGATVTVPDVSIKRAILDVQATNVDDVNEALDTLELTAQDTMDVRVTLPRIVRFSASAWANRILQIDLSATAPFTGDFKTPLAVDIGTTWRFVRQFPLRAGIILGGHQGFGYSAGFAVESRNFLFQLSGQSLGGLFRNARGFGTRLDLGFFF
jgi:hypothetical protein